MFPVRYELNVYILFKGNKPQLLPHRLRPPEAHLTLNGRNIPLRQSCKISGGNLR
jgi:hypothetical protein